MSKIVFKSVSKVFTMTFLLGLTTVPVNVLTVCALAKPGVAYLFLFPLFIGVSVWLFMKVARWIAKQMQGSKACEEEMRWYEYCYVVGVGLVWFGMVWLSFMRSCSRYYSRDQKLVKKRCVGTNIAM